MGAFIEQEITEARMLIDDMIKESLELCQNNSPTAIEGRGGTPRRCLSHGFIHSDKASQSFSFAIFDSTLQMSVERQREKTKLS